MFYGKIAMALLSSLLLLFIFFMARKAANTTVAFIALSIGVFFPDFIYSTTILNSEIPFTVLVCSGVLLLSTESNEVRNLHGGVLALSGLLFGAGALFRPIALITPVAVFIMYVSNRVRSNEAISATLIFTLAMAIPLSPWMYRNYTLFNSFIPVSTNGGYNLLCGNNKDGTVVWLPEKKLLGMLPETTRNQWQSLNEHEQDKRMKGAAIHFIQSYPGNFIKRMPKKFYHTFLSPDVPWLHWNIEGLTRSRLKERSVFSILAGSSRLFWYLIFILSVTNILLFQKLRSDSIVQLSTALVILWTMIPLIYWGKARFRFPLYPFLIVMAASSCYYLTIGRKKGI